MISRRAFLIGAGAFLTPSFLLEARACIKETGAPLLPVPPNPRQMIFAYAGMGGSEERGILLTLGEGSFEAPDPPLWKDYLRMEGCRLDRLSDIRAVLRDRSLYPEELRRPLDGYSWESIWEYEFSPSAKAYDLLKSLRLERRIKGLERAGRISFHEFPNPMSSAKWVEARDELSLSLLQARLRELDVPIALVMGDPARL